MGIRGSRQLEHAADLSLEVWAESEEDLLVEVALALAGLLTDQTEFEADQARTLRIDCLDREDRLVQWANEIIAFALIDGFILVDVEEIRLYEGGLEAVLIGRSNSYDHVQTELKSVTYHGLKIVEAREGFMAQMVIDV